MNQQLWRQQKEHQDQYFKRDDIYNSRTVIMNQVKTHQLKSPLQQNSQKIINGMPITQYNHNAQFLQQLTTQDKGAYAYQNSIFGEAQQQSSLLQFDKSQLLQKPQSKILLHESGEKKGVTNSQQFHLRSFQQDFREMRTQQRNGSNNHRIALSQNQRFVNAPQTPQFVQMKMQQYVQMKNLKNLSPDPPSSQKESRNANIFNNQIIQKKADGQIRTSQQLIDAAEQLFIQKQLHLQMLHNDLKSKKIDQKSFHAALINANLYFTNQQNQLTIRRQSEEQYTQADFQEYVIQQQKYNAEQNLQYAHSKKQRELLKAKEYSQNMDDLRQNHFQESPQSHIHARTQSGNREKIIDFDQPPTEKRASNFSEQETGTTLNRGQSIDSSDQKLSKVSEESFRGRNDCESEGDLDEEIIDKEGDDDEEAVDPNAYGDENDSEEEAKEAPKKEERKEQANKKKSMQIEEEVKEKKPAVPRAPWRQKKEEKAAEKAKEKKPNKKCNKLLASMPANWETEEAKFFEMNYDYDPQFVYDSPATNKRFLKMFPAPKTEYLPQAKQIIDKFLETYGSESNYFATEGRLLTDKDEVEKIIWDYLEELGPEVKSVARINFSNKNVASTSVTYDNWTNKIRINVQLPIQYREGRIKGVLHHEIGSHFLRRFNEVQQPWHNERKKYGLKSSITIEEGSGCINMFIEQAKDPKKWTFLFKPALNYYMCCKASELSFKELFNDLEKYVDNPLTRYKYVLRVKRGLADTSQPGGLYKDQVYLEGALKLLEHRNEIDWQGFYSAKLNIEDLNRPRLMKKLKKADIVLPKFVENVEEYKKCLDVIAKHNFID